MKYCATYLEGEKTNKAELVERWMQDNLIRTFAKGEKIIVRDLVNDFLLEGFQNRYSIWMQNGRWLVEAPKDEAWEEANQIYLMNNTISKALIYNCFLKQFSILQKPRKMFDNHKIKKDFLFIKTKNIVF